MKSRLRASRNKARRVEGKESLLGSNSRSNSPPPSPSPFDDFHIGPSTIATEKENEPDNASMLSFDAGTNSSFSQLPVQNRFLPQHDPKEDTRQVQRASGALQFVPAYDESTAPTPAVTNKSTDAREEDNMEGTAWDDIIEADDHSGTGSSRRSREKARGVASSPRRSHSSSSSRGRVVRSTSRSVSQRRSPPSIRCSPRTKSPTLVDDEPATVLVEEDDDTSRATTTATATTTTTAAAKRGSRVARLKSIFAKKQPEKKQAPLPTRTQQRPSPETTTKSSLRNNKTQPAHVPPPPSPNNTSVSGSSSGYVGWPGTQDKRGGTVAIESSYDDSSAGPSEFKRREDSQKWNTDSSLESSTDKLTPLERRMDFPDAYPREEEESDDEEENPADLHLAALVATSAAHSPKRIKKNSLSPNSKKALQNGGGTAVDLETRNRRGYSGGSSVRGGTSVASRAGGSSIAATSATGVSIQNLFSRERPARSAISQPAGDPWDVDSSPHPTSSPGTSVSKTSSAYFYAKETHGMALPSLHDNGGNSQRRSAASIIRRKPGAPQPPTEAAIAANERLSPGPRPVNPRNVRGYRGFYDKTKEVPNLIDTLDSDSVSSKATSTYSAALVRTNPSSTRGQVAGPCRIDEDSKAFGDDDSDVFDGLSAQIEQLGAKPRRMEGGRTADRSSARGALVKRSDAYGDEEPQVNLVMLGGGITTIQTTGDAFDKRATASDFDENLTNSEVDQYGFTRIPGFTEMASAGRRAHDGTAHRFGPPTPETPHGKKSPHGKSPHGKSPAKKHYRSPSYDMRMIVPVTPVQPVSPRPSPINRASPIIRDRSAWESSLTYDSRSESSFVSNNGRLARQVSFHMNDLSEYVVSPKLTRKMVGRYRELCPLESSYLTREQFEKEEDAKKAFALQEMRSRVMEKDIERGLERQGGTVTVDDLVTTPYFQKAQRVRDAVIVSKAWRDGASPKDVITASLLTTRAEKTYYVKRPLQYRASPGRSSTSQGNNGTSDVHWISYTLEAVRWVDDTDFAQLRCPSLGPRCMHGSEMFTIGDCQSILLKLTNERVLALRRHLNEATARQIEAEDHMKEEEDMGDGIMTEAEMTFLTTMEEVKEISKQLVIAERSFDLVKDRIQKLVSKYESLIVKIETESTVASSIVTYGSSYYSDDYGYSSEEDREKAQLARRAHRAELRAELAAREAIMAKQEAQKIRDEKQRELDALQQKLIELQSESTHYTAEREQSLILAKAIASNSPSPVAASPSPSPERSKPVNDQQLRPQVDQNKVDSVKQKFRDRMAARKKASGSESGSSVGAGTTRPYSPAPGTSAPRLVSEERPPLARKNRWGITGEEMFQHLDFYERSLKAVEDTRKPQPPHYERYRSI